MTARAGAEPEAARWIIGLAALCERMMTEAVRPHRVSTREWLVLTAIDANPGATVAELAAYAYAGRAGIGKLLFEMEGDGLIHVSPPGRVDGQARSIFLTDAGSAVIEDAVDARAAEAFFNRLLGKSVVDALRKAVSEMLADPNARRTAESSRRRSRMIRGLAAGGWAPSRIGGILGMGVETVRGHLDTDSGGHR